MAWSAITSVVTYSAGNAIPVTNTGSEPISVTVRRPASGADVIVTFYADGAPVHTMTTSASDPIKTSAFSAPGATALNYSTDRAFASPGASISVSTEASAPTSTPSGDVAVARAVLGLSRSPGLVYDMPNLRKGIADAISGAGDCVIGIIGDSHNAALGVGSGGTSLYNGANPFSPSTIASKIVGGRAGLRVVNDSFFGQRGVGVSYPLYDTRMGLTGAWANGGGTNVLGQNGWRSATPGDTMVYTPEQAWDTVVVYTKRNTGDTGSVRLNVPGSAGDVDLNVAGANALIATTLTKSAPDLQPLTITVLTAMSANAAILGATFYNSKARSLRIHNHAASGSQVVNHTVSAAPYSNLLAYNTISANCWMIELLHNDIQLGTTKAVWLAGWATLLATLKTATRDVIVYIGFPGNRAWATDGTMDDWIGDLKPTLDALQINMIDLRTVYGQTFAVASAAGLTYDADHGNKRGAGLYGARMASDILSYQMPSP